MIRHRSGPPAPRSDGDSSSSDEDDAFTTLCRRKNKHNQTGNTPSSKQVAVKNSNVKGASVSTTGGSSASADTSSNKRHHHQSMIRAAKMDALLQELEETPLIDTIDRNNMTSDKVGSYCLPGEENSTTNIFVGANLSPLTTEEQLTDLFRQFGDLYSVKIMWPRTAEQQARGRNSGFVCFMNRDDAIDAMNTLEGSDPFNNGRTMSLNWGRNVKKIVKRGAGGVPIPPIRGIKNGESISLIDKDEYSLQYAANDENEMHYNPRIHADTAIQVIPPSCPKRFKFISTVAFFVAKDGSMLEDKLMTREEQNPKFSFMRLCEDNNFESIDNKIGKESIFYRWRVYGFSQGDSYEKWKVEPFVMIQPHGRFWIPPPIDEELSKHIGKEDEIIKEKMQLLKKKRREMIVARKGLTTGRQIENSKLSFNEYFSLNADQLSQWNKMIDSLCCSRESICMMMAFCFDNSVAAQHISQLLKYALLDNRQGVSMETKCARLFLMSDILFNSQQGVKNAFRYRDAIEDMAPEVFTNLGRHGIGNAGRITMNKLRSTIRKVLSAWDSWSVYNHAFLDDLESLFEGKPLEKSGCNQQNVMTVDSVLSSTSIDDSEAKPEDRPDTLPKQMAPSVWMVSRNIHYDPKDADNNLQSSIDGDPINDDEFDPAALINEDLDGESLGESEISDTELCVNTS